MSEKTTDTATKEKSELIEQILANRLFYRADQQRTILAFLWSKARGSSSRSAKDAAASWEEIAAELKDKHGQGSADANVISGAVVRLRRALRAYFDEENPRSTLLVAISSVPYTLVFSRRAGQLPKQLSRILWASYVVPTVPVSIIYPEPVFFEDKNMNWYRNRLINDETVDFSPSAVIKAKIKMLTKSRHYMGIGDSKAILALSKWFLHHGVETEEKAGHGFTGLHALYEQNIIAIGNSRTIPWMFKEIDSLVEADLNLRGTGFRVRQKDVENLDPQEGEKRFYEDRKDPDLRKVFGVFYRLRHPNHDRALSIIAAQNGMAVNGISKVLTSDDKLAGLFYKMNVRDLPETFQILFSCQLDKEGNLVGTADYVTHRPKTNN